MPQAQLLIPDQHAQEVNSATKIDCGSIEIEKKITHEKRVALKVLIIFSIQSETKDIDESIYKKNFKRFKCISCELSDSLQRIGPMHSN